MSTQLKQMANEAAHLTNHSHTHGAEIVTQEIMDQCVAACMFAPEGKLATVAWFQGFFDEVNCKPHRYDFHIPKGVPEFYHLGFQFAYVYTQQLDAMAEMREVDYVQ